MEVENQVSFISPMLQNTQFGNVDDETTITFKEDADTPMTIDASAPGDVIELSDDFDSKISCLIRNTSGHCLRRRLKKPSRIST